MVKSGQSDLENGRLGLFNDHPNCDTLNVMIFMVHNIDYRLESIIRNRKSNL